MAVMANAMRSPAWALGVAADQVAEASDEEADKHMNSGDVQDNGNDKGIAGVPTFVKPWLAEHNLVEEALVIDAAQHVVTKGLCASGLLKGKD